MRGVTMRTAATLLVTAGLSCGPLSTALAWGDLAHEVICEIASEELSEGYSRVWWMRSGAAYPR